MSRQQRPPGALSVHLVPDRTPSGTPLRRCGPGDEAQVLALLDRTVDWLVEHGFTQQWGTHSFSGSERRVAQAARWVREAVTLVACPSSEPAGVLTLGQATPYVPAAKVPELYVELLATNRTPAARGLGRDLLDVARSIAIDAGVDQLRVDCFAGNGGRLVAFYESCGFTQVSSFQIGAWKGAVLVMPLPGRRH